MTNSAKQTCGIDPLSLNTTIKNISLLSHQHFQ